MEWWLNCSPRSSPPAPYVPPLYELGRPQAWLYVSKRLDLERFPNQPMWSSPVIRLGDATYYRVSPQVMCWLYAAGRTLEARYGAGQLDRDQVNAYLEAMDEIRKFAVVNIDVDAVVAAMSLEPGLPDDR